MLLFQIENKSNMKIKLKKGQSVQPRTGETHGLFGVRFVKHHNMRDVDWTANELVTQYEKISNIYSKLNTFLENIRII